MRGRRATYTVSHYSYAGHVVFRRHTTALAPKSWVGFDCFFHFCFGGGGAWPVDGRHRKQYANCRMTTSGESFESVAIGSSTRRLKLRKRPDNKMTAWRFDARKEY